MGNAYVQFLRGNDRSCTAIHPPIEGATMTDSRTIPNPSRISRRRFTGGAALAAAGLAGANAAMPSSAAAQSMDPFTYMITMPETETIGQQAGQPVDEVGPVEVGNILWTSLIQVPIKRGQDLSYTCEFDTAWCIMMAYGIDAPLDEQLAAVGIDDRVEPYWEETAEGIMIYGGDIAEYFCGDLADNLVAKAKGSAMAKAFVDKGLVATPVRSRAQIEQAITAGHPVFFKSTVDFLDWRPAIWNTLDGVQHQVVFSNDHALAVIGYNDTDVMIRDPLGPTSTNERRPFQYRVSWERFLQVFAAQEHDGLAISSDEASVELPSGDGTGGADVS